MRLSDKKGSALLETVIALLIMTTVSVSMIGMIQKSMVVSLRAREQQTCSRLSQTAAARLKNIDFYLLFAADSSLADNGLQASYPYQAVLNGIKATLASAKFDRYRVQVSFMRRDSSDSNGNGQITDLIPFADANGDLVDDYDSNVRSFDQNGDGDYYDAYTSAGRTVAEQPDTHIKRVTVDIYRRSRLVCSQTELISLEQFGGDYNPSSESVLSLLVSTPTNSSFLYRDDTPGLQSARGLAIAKAYPAEIAQFRADAASPLVISGETDPLAVVRFYVDASAELSNVSADSLGVFSAAPIPVTAALLEGAGTLRAQATKGSYNSPITVRSVILDVSPPRALGGTPAGTVNTLAPYVGIILSDPGISTTVTSGICPDVISLRVNGADVPYTFDAMSGQLVWVDSVTGTVPVLSSATYTAVVEAGDYAGYKTTGSWTFTLALPDTDNSPPAVAEKSPIGGAASQLPVISVRVFDNQSGIVPSSIELRVDGAVVVNASNVGPAYDAGTGVVSFTPSAAFEPGSSHTVQITASHWATTPADRVTSIESWNFTVP